MKMNLIIGCAICTTFLIIVLRYILKHRVNGQEWKLQKNKTFIGRWFLFGVRRSVPPMLFVMHLLLTAAVFTNVVLGIIAKQFVLWKLFQAIRTSSVLVLIVGILMIEPARNFQRF